MSDYYCNILFRIRSKHTRLTLEGFLHDKNLALRSLGSTQALATIKTQTPASREPMPIV